ncbi:hypothetical protein GCM10009765_81350 [Fodinicola feengrottensis]|uniref:Uncharacterized protein n=1 Tax=Fodinicola feengrottensis TaxID=435914 RepID=A0ABN2J9N2_9ACTN
MVTADAALCFWRLRRGRRRLRLRESAFVGPQRPRAYKGGRSCRRGDNIGLAADGAGRGWVPSKLTNLGVKVKGPHGVGTAGLGPV